MQEAEVFHESTNDLKINSKDFPATKATSLQFAKLAIFNVFILKTFADPVSLNSSEAGVNY